MKRQCIIFLILNTVLGLCILTACTSSLNKTESVPMLPLETQSQSEETPCLIPQEPFENKLIGTWVARPETATDTLILRDDHKFRQIYDDPVTKEHFETDWQSWEVIFNENDRPYLQLWGMRECDLTPHLCRGEKINEEYLVEDRCEGRLITVTSDKVLLVVIEVPPTAYYQIPNDLALCHMGKEPDTGLTCFTLIE